MKLITPSYLKKGDTVAIIAPAGILINREAVIKKAVDLLESWDLQVVLGNHVFTKSNHFAGSDEERIEDFQKALDNPNIKAIWCARGGYGSVRIIDHLDFNQFLKQPKWIIGYSDVTVFHNHIHNLGIETLHAIMGTSMQDDIAIINESVETLRKAIFGETLEYQLPSNQNNSVGAVTGQLVGGNLAILASMLGSKSQLNTTDKILFIEEIGEYEYAIDRMLFSLKRADYFKNVKGVIIGDISKVKENSTKWGMSIEDLILNVLPENVPVLFDFPAGHEPDNRALLMGRRIELSVKNKQKSNIKFINE